MKLLPNFDFTRMTALAMGRNWRAATPEQQKRVTDEFRALLVRTYSGALNNYRNETIDYKPLRMNPADTDVTVRTLVVRATGSPIQIDYSMAKRPDGWKCYDVIVGGVSLVTNYRDEFNNQVQGRRRRRPHQDARRPQQGRGRQMSQSAASRRRRWSSTPASRRTTTARSGPTWARSRSPTRARCSAPRRRVALPADGEVDLEDMGAIDSSAVAVLLALKRRAEDEGKPLRFVHVPAALVALADGVWRRVDPRHVAIFPSSRNPARCDARASPCRSRACPRSPQSCNVSLAVEFDNVTRRFGSVQALAGVSLAVEQGEFFGLLGPNGAGKTTLISVLAGLTRADSGSARVLGHDVVADYRNSRRALGVVPQELVFDPFFSVRETLAIQSGYFGIRNNDAWIDEILHHLDLTSKADANMRSLSGGMKRRVLVGQALVHKPPVIVLDEPTAGVDVELRQSLWAFIRKLNRDGHTIILTTHYLEEAEALCGRIAMLKAGRVVALDTTRNLLTRVAGLTVRLVAERVPASVAVARDEPRRPDLHPRPRALCRSRVAARGAAPRGHPRSTSSRCRRPTSSRCSCRSWARGGRRAERPR